MKILKIAGTRISQRTSEHKGENATPVCNSFMGLCLFQRSCSRVGLKNRTRSAALKHEKEKDEKLHKKK